MGRVLLIFALRWRLFLNAVKFKTSTLESIAGVILALFVGGLALVGSVVLCILTAAIYNKPFFLSAIACLLAGIMVFWQLAPVVTASFGEEINVSRFRLYPFTSRELFVADIILGLADPIAMISIMLSGSILVGCVLRSVVALPLGLSSFAIFVITNVAVSRYVRRWIARLLASRRRKEVVGLLLFLLLFVPQILFYLGPSRERRDRGSQREGPEVAKLQEAADRAYRYLAWTPPGLLARGLDAGGRESPPNAALAILAALLFASGGLALAYRAIDVDYYGGPRPSSKSGAAVRSASVKPALKKQPVPVAGVGGPSLIEKLMPWLDQASAAMFEKEMKYLFRSPRAMLIFIAPIVGSIVFLLPKGPFAMSSLASSYRLIGPIFYGLFLSSQSFNNSFCLDWHGAKLYFLTPAPGRSILIGKNLATSLMVVIQILVIITGVEVTNGPLPLAAFLNGLFVLIVALPVLLGAGNYFSLLYPKAMDFSKIFGRSNSSTASLAGIPITIALFSCVALGPVIGWLIKAPWIAYPIFLVESAVSVLLYRLLLTQAQIRMEKGVEKFLGTLLANPASGS